MNLLSLIQDHQLRQVGRSRRYVANRVNMRESLYRFEMATVDVMMRQEYFYRAASEREAELWLSGDEDIYKSAVSSSGHQGLASCFRYSDKYMSDSCPVMLEFFAPDFPEKAIKLGYISLKPEDGDVSWGLSRTNSMGINDSLSTVYHKLGVTYQLTPALWRDYVRRLCGKYGVEFQPNRHRDMANALVGYVFCDSVIEARVVEVRLGRRQS